MKMKKTIITHFFTTINISQVLRMFLFVINPYNLVRYKNWKYIKILEEKFLGYLWTKNSKIISFYNARSALFHWLKLLWVKAWDEVIIQSYTCVSVVNSVIQTWATPIFVDVDETLNISIFDLKSKITENTKVIILQHTFWNPANIWEIKKIADENNIFLIEDCAHSLWAEYDSKKVGTFWDLSVFSFWRDKVISTVNGGFLVINNEKYFSKVNEIKSELVDLWILEILKNIAYIFISFKAKIFYDFLGLGKFIIFISRKLHLVPEVLSCLEKSCQEKNLYFKYPNVLAFIWVKELEKVDFYNNHRIKLAKIYEENLWKNTFPKTLENTKNIYLRFVYFSKNREELKKYFRQNDILLWDWYQDVIAPAGTILEKTWYKIWSSMNAEKYSSLTTNLPNHIWISEIDAFRVIDLIKKIEK